MPKEEVTELDRLHDRPARPLRGGDPPRHRPAATGPRPLGRSPARPCRRADRLAPPGQRASQSADRRRRRGGFCGRPDGDAPPPQVALSSSTDLLTLPMPSRPGPTWAPRTAPISEMKAGSQPKISRASSARAAAVSSSWMCWTTQASSAGLVALAGVVAQALDRAGAGADPLHRRDLLLQGEDRLDLQRRADEGAGAADPPAAPQVLEGVDREPHLQLLAGLLGAGERRVGVAACCGGGSGAERAEAHPAGRRARVEELDPLAALALVDEALAGLAGGLAGAGDPRRDVDRGDLAAGVEQRLVDGERSRRSRAGRSSRRSPMRAAARRKRRSRRSRSPSAAHRRSRRRG